MTGPGQLPGPDPDDPVGAALDAVRHAPTIVRGMRLGDDLVAAAGDDLLGSALPRLAEAVSAGGDDLTAIAAVHAIGAIPGGIGRPALLALIDTGQPHLREHAAQALRLGPPHVAALPPLTAMVSGGGFAGVLAQLTLETWAQDAPAEITAALVRGLTTTTDAGARARLVETLGLVPGPSSTELLLATAVDDSEAPAARAAAVAALGDDPVGGDPQTCRVLEELSDGAGPLAETALTARQDLRAATARETGAGGRPADRHPPGLTVVQPFLHADIDAGLTQAGRGDNGGIATLLVQLGDALVGGRGAVTRTVTVSRGRPADGAAGLDALTAPGHHFAPVPLWGPPVHAADAWPLRVAARRGIRRILRAAQPVDVLHLRMADVGSLAAAEAADELGVPVVFTLAPDPHAQIDVRETAGTLTRAGFGAADHTEHLVFRDELLRRLAGRAAHLVLFPRRELREDICQLLGVDLTQPDVRASVVAEGVDLEGIRRAATDVAAAGREDARTPRALTELDTLLQGLPPGRRGLPLALTVGRLHPVKGMATLVETWATSDLGDRCNLLVVGGDLETPTSDEATQLERVHAVVPHEQAAHRGLLLAGHRPHAVVAVWMAATRLGRPGLAAPHGVYVCASLKEEFGIAVLEAMASGLVVVGPADGGPPTYVEEGVTGLLVDTSDAGALAAGVRRALTMSHDVDAATRADAAREVVRARFGIDTMASALDGVYQRVAAVPREHSASGDPRIAFECTPQGVGP